MPDYLMSVTLDSTSGFDEDAVVNTFVVHAEAPISASIDQQGVMANIANFYSSVPPASTRTLGSYLAGHLTRDTASNIIKMYEIADLSGAAIADGGIPMGSPINFQTFTIAAAGSLDSLPSQVALAVTLRGRTALEQPVENAAGLRPRQRRSGKLYLGPFNTDANDVSGVNQISRPVSDLRNTIANAAEKLQDDMEADGVIWGVWSRSQEAVYGITSVEVDNSWDVMRSRQQTPTDRLKRVFSPVPALELGA